MDGISRNNPFVRPSGGGDALRERLQKAADSGPIIEVQTYTVPEDGLDQLRKLPPGVVVRGQRDQSPQHEIPKEPSAPSQESVAPKEGRPSNKLHAKALIIDGEDWAIATPQRFPDFPDISPNHSRSIWAELQEGDTSSGAYLLGGFNRSNANANAFDLDSIDQSASLSARFGAIRCISQWLDRPATNPEGIPPESSANEKRS